MKTLDITTKQSAVGSLLLTGMRAHSGIVGDKDDLFILEPTDEELGPEQGVKVLYELAKLTGKSFASWQPVQVDLNFNQTGKIMVFQKYFDPYHWNQGEIIHCTPNEKLIEYVKTAVSKIPPDGLMTTLVIGVFLFVTSNTYSIQYPLVIPLLYLIQRFQWLSAGKYWIDSNPKTSKDTASAVYMFLWTNSFYLAHLQHQANREASECAD